MNLLVVSHDTVGSRMAGPGIRYWELARAVAAHQRVTLIAPEPIDLESPAFRCGDYSPGDAASLARWLRDADVVLANGFVLEGHPELARIDRPLALDLYDPVLLENLEILRSAPDDQRAARCEYDRELLGRQLAAGDFFLCATERQRDLYVGALMAAGRVTPALVDADPHLRNLIAVVPSGVPSEPPVKRRPALRGVAGGIGADDPLLLWSGGLWDWMDPLTLIRALPEALDIAPRARLVFLAGAHPGLARPPRMPAEARALAAGLGLLDRHVFFYERWVPYDRRADFLLEADLLVYMHRQSLESAYAAVRSRFLDHLWAGRASLVSAGDAAAELVLAHDLGRVAAPGPAAAAEALRALLRDPALREGCAGRARTLATEFAWERVAAPLLDFCRAPLRTRAAPAPRHGLPERASDRSPIAVRESRAAPGDAGIADESIQTGTGPMDDQTRAEAIKRLEDLWNVQPRSPRSGVPLVGQTKELVISLTRWYLQSILEQQNAFNAAVVQALHALSANDDRRHNEVLSHVLSLHNEVNGMHQQLNALLRRIERSEQHLHDVDDAETALAATLVEVQQQLAARDGEHEA